MIQFLKIGFCKVLDAFRVNEENDWVDGALDKSLLKMTTAKVKKNICIMPPFIGKKKKKKFIFSSVPKKLLQMVTAAMKLKDAYSLKGKL